MNPGMLSGKKTYIVAIAGIVAAWLSYLTGGEILGQFAGDLKSALDITYVGLIGLFLRQGVAKAADPNKRN